MIQRHALNWSVGFTRDAAQPPEVFVPARVPGAVQLDWARAQGWGDAHYADNWRDYGWMEDVCWLYRAPVDVPALAAGQRLFFVCGGIDYRFEVRVNGKAILAQEGMFTPVELDLTDAARPGDTLEVLVFPAPKSASAPADRTQANQSCKPAVSYSWDFHPRLIPAGIWQEAGLEVRPAVHIAEVSVGYTLADDLSRVEVTADVELSAPGEGEVLWRLLDPEGRAVAEQRAEAAAELVTLHAAVERPRLWWPHDQGEPALYRSVVELRSPQGETIQRSETRIGFRRVQLIMHPGAWEEPDVRFFPKGRSHPPITLEINGRAIFAKGTNWVTPDVFPGRVDEALYRRSLTLARDAHMNLLRCWGGANVQKEAFFDLCDELGIMVWQEFPLACNRYAGTPAYLRVLDQESKSIIRRLKPHPSVALWCGGNELFNAWSGMTEQDLALRLLNRNCYDLDPARPFLPTSPVDGMGHGHYVFRSMDGREVFRLFAEARCTAYTEFGCGSPGNADAIRAVIPPEDLFPPREGTAWETHHAMKAWQPNSHLVLDVIEDYFGPMKDLDQLVECGQRLQGEGLKCLFEEARRQKPRAAMALNWCFNEPWPCAANMSILSWPASPKKSYAEVRSALRPVLASARIAKFRWQEGELFNPEIWLLNDSPKAVPAGRIEAWIETGGQRVFLLGWDHAGTAANTNLPGPVVRFALPPAGVDHFRLRLEFAGHPEWSSTYYLRLVPAAKPASPATPPLNQ